MSDIKARKKLVIFCDGTWNEPTERGTNVVRMLQATDFADADDRPQLTHYIAGVGTRKDEKVIGGAFGFGISDNIKDAYAFIVSNYEVGDEIYLFGFSRGPSPPAASPGSFTIWAFCNAGICRSSPSPMIITRTARRSGVRTARPRKRFARTIAIPIRRRSNSSACGTRSARSARPMAKFSAG